MPYAHPPSPRPPSTTVALFKAPETTENRPGSVHHAGAPGCEEPGSPVETDQTLRVGTEHGAGTEPCTERCLPQSTCFHTPEQFLLPPASEI